MAGEHTLSLPFPPVSLKSRTHACSFVCYEGLKNVFNTGENIFIQTFSGLCEGFIKKTSRHKHQTFSTLNLDKIKICFCFISDFLSIAVSTLPLVGNCQFMHGRLTQSKTQQVIGRLRKSCQELALFQVTLAQMYLWP